MKIEQKPFIFDGSMGTYYNTVAAHPLTKCELANVENPKLVRQIHEEYIRAGCDAIKTNTFGVNSVQFEENHERVRELIEAGYRLAIEASIGHDVKVFADIGPIEIQDETITLSAYKEVIDLFVNLGASYFLFETFSTANHLAELARYIKLKVPDAYIITSFAVSPEGFTRLGESGRSLFETLEKVKEVDAVGFNCFSGPSHLLNYIKKMPKTDKHLIVMPNSGYPTVINNRTFFAHSKQYFANQLVELVQSGVHIVGGCCGTTPEFIKLAVDQLKHITVAEYIPTVKEMMTKEEKAWISPLRQKMMQNKKVIAVELDPPIDTQIDFFMSSAKQLKEIGVDALTIADCPIARARVDSSLLACKLKRELDITAIPHMTCRDRNINATKALLLGLNIEGISDVLVVTGDPIPTAQRDEIKAMFSYNSSTLAHYIQNLNETCFSHPFSIYGALNVNSPRFDRQLESAQRKIAQGVTGFLTQPVMTQAALDNLKLAKETLDAKILGGIMPIVSHKNACFMNNEISGIKVAEEIIALYENLNREAASKLAVKIATETAKAITPYVDGYYLITPFKRIDLMLQIISQIKSF